LPGVTNDAAARPFRRPRPGQRFSRLERQAKEAQLIFLSGVAVEYGGRPVLQDVSVTFGPRQRWGLVGRNGTGKTTLLNVILGRVEPTRGTATVQSGLRFSLLDQHRELAGASTVWEAAAAPFAEVIALEHTLHELAAEMGRLGEGSSPELLSRYDRAMERFQHADGYAVEARVDAVLDGLGFDPAAARRQPVTQLSGGELGRVGLAAQLVAPGDVLLLDEPTNHLDLDTTRWLEDYLVSAGLTVLVISHDRAFLEAVADHVLHFESGTATPYAAGFSGFVQQRAERRLAQERAFAQQQRQIAADEDFIRRNIAGQKSRLAKSRRTRLQRMPRLSPPASEDDSRMGLRLEPADRGGDQVLVTRDLEVAVPGRTLLGGFSTRVQRGDVIGLVGANGSGKSSLLKVVAGEWPAAAGEVRCGQSVTLGYYRQDLAQVPLDRTLFEIIHDLRPLWHRGQVHGHLGRFGFSGDEALKKAGVLSGGELARVALALLMLSRANLLLLDEPTNHLDVESIEALEDALDEYEGSVLLVSHDRALLRGVATRVWALENGVITDYDGTFAEWEEHTRSQAAAREQERREAEAAAAARNRPRPRPTPPPARGPSPRRLRAALDSAEQEVHRLEAVLAAIETELAADALYRRPDGVARAAELTRQRDTERGRLATALAEWERAAEALEAAEP
jgi:ATP-binding cassette subfamily F protein 3